MISVIQNGNQYDIKFPYDPIAIDLVKNVPGRRWNPQEKVWSIPKDRLGFLLSQFKGTVYESSVVVQSNEQINVNQSLDETKQFEIPDIDISDVNFRIADGFKPFKHQLDCMRYYKWRIHNGYRSGFILADKPGAGKTLQGTNVALYKRDYFGSKHCLVICCVNGAKYNWYEDIIKHTNGQEKPYILGSRIKRDKSGFRCNTGSKEKLKDLQLNCRFGKEKYGPLPYFIIVNIESLRAKEGKKYVITEEIIKWIELGLIDTIIIDEIHKNASPSSKQGQQLLNIKKKITKPVDWIPMTGTPITKKPTDVFTPLRLIDGHSYGSFYMWCQQFCIYGGFGGHDIIGYKNIDKLKAMLQPNMLRRLKSDFIDLLPKLPRIEYVDNTDYQDKLYDEIVAQMEQERDAIVKSLNPMTAFLRLRQVNGAPELVDDSLVVDDKYYSKNAKLQRMMELIDEYVDNGEKVLVFSNWVEPLRTLYKFISKKYKVCCYTGTMSSDVREQHKKVFMTNPNYPVMIGTVGAMGTSHTLTAASNIIFYDEPWNPSDKEQCEDRCHRPGQTESLNIVTLISRGTVDERVHNILFKKEGISDYIVDGQLDLRSHPELFDLLLGKDNTNNNVDNNSFHFM